LTWRQILDESNPRQVHDRVKCAAVPAAGRRFKARGGVARRISRLEILAVKHHMAPWQPIRI